MNSSWKVIGAFIGVFIAGAVFGGFFTLRTTGKRGANEFGVSRFFGVGAPVASRLPPLAPTDSSSTQLSAAAEQYLKSRPVAPVAGSAGVSLPLNQPNQVPPIQTSASRVAPALMNQISKRISPTLEQREKIRPIVSRASEDTQRMQREYLQDTARVSERMYEDVAALLTADQRVHLEKMRHEMRERVRKEREKRGDLPLKPGASARQNGAGQPGSPPKAPANP